MGDHERPARPVRGLLPEEKQMGDHIPYQSYLVRLWPVQRGGVAGYRVTVQSVATGERWDFANLESLLAFWSTLRASPEAGELSKSQKEE
jgi:hypothetical protein